MPHSIPALLLRTSSVLSGWIGNIISDAAHVTSLLLLLQRRAQWAASNELRKAAKVCGVQKWQTYHLQQVARSQIKLLGW